MKTLALAGALAIAVLPGSRPRFRLAVAGPAALASGWVELAPAQSPFVIGVSKDGHIVYDLDVNVHDLPPAALLGAYTSYHAWLATPNLGVVRSLGPITNDTPLRAKADWNKFTVIVSAEPAPVGAHWRGAIVLVGRSPSSLMQSFAGHPFYNTGMPPE